MSKKDFGYDFLNSDDSGFIRNDDGDLSSFDYYEEDDDGEDEDEDDDADDLEISAGAAIAVIVGGLIGVGLAAYAANKQKRDEERREEERRIAEQERIRQEKADRRRKKRISFYRRHWKGIFVFFLILGLSGFAGYKYWDYQKQIAIGSSTEELLGENYEDVIEKLKDAGFTNVDSNPMYDLSLDEIEQEFLVTEVSIRGSSKFSATDKYAYDARIEVTYHVVENVYTPLSSKEAKKQLYEDVVTSFKNAGFANITTVADPDLITGWITKDGSVEEIAVNGDTSFDENDRYRPDCEVVITYHTFK